MEEQESSSFINQKQILIRNNQEENWRTTTIKELISKKNELVFKFTGNHLFIFFFKNFL